jgi:hypothetical protein
MMGGGAGSGCCSTECGGGSFPPVESGARGKASKAFSPASWFFLDFIPASSRSPIHRDRLLPVSAATARPRGNVSVDRSRDVHHAAKNGFRDLVSSAALHCRPPG